MNIKQNEKLNKYPKKLKANKLKADRGYTLVELLVSIAVFSIVVVINTNMFLNAISGQRKAIASQNVSDSTRYAMEIMTKEIRIGAVDSFVLNNPSDISFVSNSENRATQILRFVLDNRQVKFDDNFNGDFSDMTNARAITSTQNTNVISLNFDINNIAKQPKITILMNVESKNTPQNTRDEIYLQTTISPRELNL